jgi:hypothetical protein
MTENMMNNIPAREMALVLARFERFRYNERGKEIKRLQNTIINLRDVSQG